MIQRRPSPFRRTSTKKRFRSILHKERRDEEMPVSWYRQRGNFITLLMIFVILFLAMAMKAYLLYTKNFALSSTPITAEKTPSSSEEMDYEEAKSIFEGKQKQSPHQ
ncbi:MAG: hypothetical protein AB1656_07570 [Candidatus Omnitrophota bacterium]